MRCGTVQKQQTVKIVALLTQLSNHLTYYIILQFSSNQSISIRSNKLPSQYTQQINYLKRFSDRGLNLKQLAKNPSSNLEFK